MISETVAVTQTIAAFTDAINRRDFAVFRTLWTPDAVWAIDPPIDARFSGVGAIAESLIPS